MSNNLNLFNDLIPIGIDEKNESQDQNLFLDLIDDKAGKTIDSSTETQTTESNVMGSNLEDGSLEQPGLTWEKAISDVDIYSSLTREQKRELARKNTGKKSGYPIFSGSPVSNAILGSEIIDAVSDIPDWIKASQSAEFTETMFNLAEDTEAFGDEDYSRVLQLMDDQSKKPPSAAMQEYYKTVEEEGGGAFGVVKAFAKNPKIAPEALVTSLAGMIRATGSNKAAKYASLAGYAGLATGGPVRGGQGLFSGLSMAMETTSKFSELLSEEMKDMPGGFTEENLKKIVEDKDRFQKIKNKAYGKGITVGIVDFATGGLTTAVSKKVLQTTGSKIGTVAAGTVVEGVGGGTGEALGSVVIGEDVDAASVGLEIFAEYGRAPLDIGAALVKPNNYILNGQKVSFKEMKNFVETADDIDVATADIKIEGDNVLAEKAYNKQNDAILETQVNEKVEDPADRKKMVELEKQRAKAEADAKKKGIQAVPDAKETLENIEMQMNEIVGKYTAVDGRTKDVKARKKAAEQVRENIVEKDFQANLEFAKKHSKLYGLEVDDTMTIDQIKKQYGDEAATSDGFITPDNKIIINKTVAKNTGAVNVGNHELLHGILRKAVKEGKINKNLINDFKEKVGTDNWSKIEQRIKDAGYTEKYMKDTPEEYLTLFSDAIANNDIKFDENIFTKVGDLIKPVLRAFGFKKIDFETADGVYDFLKEYNRSIHKGALSSAIVKATEGKVDVEGIKFAKSPLEAIKALVPKTVKTQEDYYALLDDPSVTERILSPTGKLAPVIEAYIRSRSTSPEMAQKNIETVRDRLVNFDPAAERADGTIVGPEGFGEFIFANARFGKMVAAEKLAIEGEKRKRTTSIDDPDVTDIPDDTPTPTKKVEDKTKKTVVSSRLGVKNKVDEAVKKQLPKLDVENLTFKKIKNLVPEITGELFGISPKKLKTLANITKPELQKAQMYISKNADLLLAMLPEGTTISGTSTGVPNTLLAAFYTKTTKAKLAKTGSRAGLPIQIKNKNITKKQFLEVFGIIDGVPVRTDRNTSARVLALANLTGKMMTNQAVRQNLELLGNSEQTIKNIREGASNVMFSKSNKIVKKHNLPDLNINDPKNGIENYNTFLDKMTLLSTFLPDRFIRRTDLYNFGISNQTVRLYAREQTKELGGTFLIGQHPDRVYQRPDKALGQSMKDITKAKVEKYNKIGSSNFNDMVNGIRKAIEANPNDKELHTAIFMYLSSAVNDTTHPMRAGAEYVGGDVTNTGGILYEHALQNANTRDEILDAILDNKKDFKKTMKSIKKNYKLIAMSIADAATVDSTTYIDENGKAVKFKNGMGLINGRPWDLFKDNWFDRYFNLVINSIDPKKYKVFKNGKTFADEYSVTKSGKVNFSKSVSKTKTLDNAVKMSRAVKPSRGITVLDFDDTLATTKSLVKYTTPDGKTGTLNAEQYASTYEDLLDQGFTFDFSDFNKVVKGKLAPLFNKAMKLQGKFGPENMFVLTARPPAAQKAIFDFLKANGLNIPLKNITGLGNSTAEAKALWIADKVGEGYNDFYFADDALQNVQAVKNMLDQFDVKSKVQQAKVKFSKSMNKDFNDILENVTGIESKKRFSAIKGRKRGASKGKFRFFIPPSHEDFVGLLYNFLGKGKEGNAHRDFFEKALIGPLNRANREYDTARQSVANDYKALNKQFPDIRKKLTKKTPDGDFTFQDAIRVYLWNKHDHNIPGLSETDQTNLSELVMSDPQLQSYAETLNVISKQDTYVTPTDGWNSGDIRMDLDDATGRIGRQQFFAEFIENAEVIFSEENLNKIEAGYGKGVRESLEDMLYRIKTGRNRPTGQNAQVNKLMNYLNGSVGTVMFFNMRSALLQQMSLVNYINFADNNIFAAAKAFANQKQYWKDWAFIFNSDMLKQRRGGIQTDINGAELAASLRNSKDMTRKLISKLLELGFLPTQIGDNIAIATGGATFYRNRINTYLKQGLNKKEAEAKAFDDFQATTQSTQQSARPDMVSKQQASVIGKVILNFQNVTSQFNRLGKKAFQDIYNRRITKPNTTQMQSDISNAARITYYFAVQNAIFYTLQTALFAMMFDDDEEDVNNLFLKKRERLINGSIDSVLRGSGLIGGVVATLKNVAIAFARQRDVRYNPDESAVLLEALNLSPVLGIKGRKIVNAEKTLNYNKKVIKEMETFDIDNPMWSAVTNHVEWTTNIPLNRLYNKTQNVRQALNNEHAAWERTLMFLGWSQYNLDLENKKMEDIKEKVKSKKKSKPGSKKKSTNTMFFDLQ